MDEARVGQKGRLCHRWWSRGRRPRGRCDRRFQWAYIFAAVEPATGADAALVLPQATAATMSLFLTEFAAGLAEDVHAVLVLDRAGWHGAKALTVPANVTLVPLPPYSPELNPVERVWLYLRERFLSLRVLADHRAGFTHEGFWSYTQTNAGELNACRTSVLPTDARAGRADFRPKLGANGSHA